ncbi:hypothetical protein HG535_0G04720 [Zygotorulaspora mrakii]|uniref:Uncharacterized protein n=1 Tax=Zygotorulaspora mrakii TaxID=42260 RepID=A0A7H9B992_ZYGMR|nr:uncharacterized protein HG535_0G04720 [Zygotorulaspora mrakii]QLG74589.1 hypothetical protein HG535_0G04720 [Zygotorulaspora mrakii]
MAKHSSSPKSTPGTESVNKWKIPHYYRRSSSASSQQSGVGESVAASTPSTPNINVMTSPKRVLMDDPKKGKKRSSGRLRKKGKKKAGEMVFVNYTVQDSASESESGTQSSSSTTPVDVNFPATVSNTNDAINRRKKSSRSRMLEIFGSSKHGSDKKSNQNVYCGQEMNSQSLPDLPKNGNLTGKRSYGSFLKYGRFYGSSVAAMQSSSGSEYTDDSNRDVEFVPKSSNNPKTVRPFVQANSEIFASSHKGIHLLGRKKAYSEVNISHRSVDGSAEDELSIDHHYLDEDKNSTPTNVFSNRMTMASEPSLAGSNRLSDENDASIAFTKMFTKKRANTGGSMSSLVSLNNNLQQQNASPQANPNMMVNSFNKNLSLSSISSASNRYSPIRTASPARPRSATRVSSSHRISRDSSSLQNTFDITDATALSGPESFLDIHTGTKNTMAMNARHKRKQDSISDTYRNSANNNASTPSSSLVTPPAITSGYTVVSSTSASSTPSVLELPNAGQTNTGQNGTTSSEVASYSNLLDHNSSSEVLNQSEMPTPTETLPTLKGIPRTTLEENEEEAQTDKRYLQVNNKTDNFENIVFVNGSSTESSQVDSLLTNSVFSSATSTFWTQDQGSFTMSINGNNVNNNGKFDEANYSSSLNTSNITPSSTTNNKFENLSTDDILRGTHFSIPNQEDLKTHMEFDFENTNSFFQDRSSKNTHGNYGNASLSGAFFNEQASTVTSVANVSPGTAATLSIEDVSNGNPYQRTLRDQYNGNSSMIQSSSGSPQLNTNVNNSGAWNLMNSDLDAIANSFFVGEDMNDQPPPV